MLNASHRIAHDWEKNLKKITKCTNNWISVSHSSSPKIILKRKYPKPAHIRFWTSINAAGMHFCSLVACFFVPSLHGAAIAFFVSLLVCQLTSSRLHGHTLLTFFSFFSYDCWIMRANLADRGSPFRVFICVADLLLAAIFLSLSPFSPPLKTSSALTFNTCVSQILCVSCAKYLKRAYDFVIYLFIYLVLVQWCAKVHS